MNNHMTQLMVSKGVFSFFFWHNFMIPGVLLFPCACFGCAFHCEAQPVFTSFCRERMKSATFTPILFHFREKMRLREKEKERKKERERERWRERERAGAYTGGGSPLPMNPPRSFKFRFNMFKINGMRAHCVRARFSRSTTAVFHRMRMRRSFNFQGSDCCRARKTVYV